MKKLFTIILFFFLCMINKNISAQNVPAGSDTITTSSGLKYVVLQKGGGEKVELNKEVAFDWTGYFLNGESFGTSRGSEPFYFVTGKGQVIKGAEEGLSLMCVGDRYLFIMHPELAYGAKGTGGVIPPNATLVFDYEIVSVTNPKLSIADTMHTVIMNDGIEAGIVLYKKLSEEKHDEYSFRESSLNNLGYKLIREEKTQDAIEIFKLNTEIYPESWNVFDSLAESYMAAGDYPTAIKYYKKSLELNPDNTSAINNIEKMSREK